MRSVPPAATPLRPARLHFESTEFPGMIAPVLGVTKSRIHTVRLLSAVAAAQPAGRRLAAASSASVTFSVAPPAAGTSEPSARAAAAALLQSYNGVSGAHTGSVSSFTAVGGESWCAALLR